MPFALAAEAAVPTLSSPANDACLATLKGTTTEEGSHKWFFYGKTAAERKALMNGGANSTLRAKMGNTYGDHPKTTTFSWSGTPPFTLTIKRADGTVFLRKSGLAVTSLAVDNFEIAASYTWTVSNVDGTSSPRAFTTEDTVPRLLNGSSQVDYTQGSVTTKVPHGVRDMGGYIGLDGRRARQGLLIRNSAFESDANSSGEAAGMKIKYIDDTNRPFWNEFIKVRTEIDLRNNSESTLTQSTLGSGVTYKRFTNLPAWKKYMTGTYASSFKRDVKGIFGYLADAGRYPISFHCTHGKDRTGMVAFLIGSVLGYSESDIYADYEATIFWHPTQGVSLETSDANGFVDYLNDSTASGVTGATIQEKAVNFIKGCGVTDVQLEAFREIMLEPIEEDKPWTGKTVAILGDSYSTFAGVSGDPANVAWAGHSACDENNPFYPDDLPAVDCVAKTWWGIALNELGGTLGVNASVGGSCMTRDVGSSVGIDKDGRYLIRSFANRTANGALGDPDVILVLGGLNDAWGKVSDADFETGVATLFANLKHDYPSAQVVVVSLGQDGTAAVGVGTGYRKAIFDEAAKNGFLVVDLNDASLVSGDYSMSHPNVSGMQKIAAKVVEVVTNPPEPAHVHASEQVSAVAATYATPGRTAGTRCSDCGEILSGCEAVPILTSAITLSATVVADGRATVTLGNVQAPVVLSVVYGNEDRGDVYYDDADWDGGTDSIGWDDWLVVGCLPAGTTTKTCTIPNWGVDAADGRQGAKYARFILTPYEQTPVQSIDKISGTDPTAQWFDTGLVPGTALNTTLHFRPTSATAGKTLFDTPSRGTKNPYLRYGLSVSSDRKVQLWYSNSDATGGSGCGESFGSQMTVGTLYNAVLQASGNRGRMRVDGTSSYSNSSTASAPTAAADGTIRVCGVCDIVRFSTAGAVNGKDVYMQPCLAYNANGELEACLFDSTNLRMCFSEGGTPFAAGTAVTYRKDQVRNVVRLAETATIEYAVPPPDPTEAPGGLAPDGVTVALHTDRQKAFLALSRDERRANYTDPDWRAGLAEGSGAPKPVTLAWTGDGECMVTVVRAKDRKAVFTTTLVGNAVDVWNLEINTAYEWTVVNALGTAKGTFTIEDEAPRLLRDPLATATTGIRGIRDLGGRVGLGGRRVRQGRVFRCSQLNKEESFVTDANRGLYLDELGIRTDLDFRSGDELYGITSSPLGPSVRWVNAQIGSYTGLFGSTTGFKKTFDTFLDEANYPIVFHCAAGRDRTGVVAFLLNALLGVDEEELIKDWEANAFWNADVSFCHANLDTFYTTLATKANGGATVQEQAVNAVLNMGYTMADVAKFRSLMLEPAEEPGAMPAALVISEVCARCQPKAVPACKDLGWIEFYNGSNETVNLRDYKLLVLNRGKKIDAAKNILPLADCEIAPGGYALVYTSETFGNAAVAEVEDTFAGRGTITVYPKKINQKKYPFVQLFRGDELLQTVVVPVDLADEKSYTTVPERKILATPTPGATNGTAGVAYGPNVSSLYGVKDAPDPWRAFPKAQVGEDYEVSFPVNPADMSAGAEDEIACVRLLYRIGFGAVVEGPVMIKSAAADAKDGWVYTGTIPGVAFAKAGELVRFAALITDGMGRTWRSPSFCNPDDGYEWYGTIVAPGTAEGEGTESANLQTFHLFADAASREQMDVDADKQDPAKVPWNARCGVYDSTTGLYYDNVRIDLRGNTSGGFVKKSHGLRFSKAQPLSCTDPVTGTEVKEVRKTSFIGEFPDVSGVRQMMAFKAFNDNGSPAPFHYPVRLNLNGEFFELAYHSERFSDELIEDLYGFDPLGYAYKNVGRFESRLITYAGRIEKKTPDDDREDDLSVLAAFVEKLKPVEAIGTDTDFSKKPTCSTAISKIVVEDFDLPAWLNYLALERITGERDGLDANVSAYYDVRGTGTWRPLAYDMNLSFGAYNTGSWRKTGEIVWDGAVGLKADDDPGSHPLVGGLHTHADNRAVECIFQSAKFRRLYLRRLRTLMDRELKVPGTALEGTPLLAWAKGVLEKFRADAAIDRAKWMTEENIPSAASNWVWYDHELQKPIILTLDEGWQDLWDNYIVKRRIHLFETHSAANTAKPIGYGTALNAGIPSAQAATSDLKGGFSFANVAADALVIRNGNAEAVDMSGWTLTGKVTWTIPAGTVIDANDVLTVVADRRAYVAAHEAELGEQVIVGNAAFDPSAASLVLADDADVKVVEVGVPPPMDVGEATATPGTDFVGATVVLELGPQFAPGGDLVSAMLAVNGETVEGEVDLEAKTVTFAVETTRKGETYVGEVTLTVGEEQLERSVTLEQGRRIVVDASDGWIREGETEVADSLLVTPETPAPETAQVVLKARLELGAGAEEGTFDAADQVGVMAVTTQDGTAYLFKTAEGVVTNVSASAEPGAETEVEILADYARRTVRYVIGGETNGPFALPAGAQRANAVNLGGSGNLKYLNGDYEIMGLNTNLAASGGAEYATVAEAVAAGGPVTLLWDASWVPTEGGDYSFVSNGHELKVGGDLAFEVKDNGDGTLSVTVTGTIEEPVPATIALRGGMVVIGVANPDSKRSYALARAKKLGDEFVPDESTWKTGAEILSGSLLEASVTPGATSEFFKVVVR